MIGPLGHGFYASQYPPEEPICEQCYDDVATVYAIDPKPDGWGGYYCRPCVASLKFTITETLTTNQPQPNREVHQP